MKKKLNRLTSLFVALTLLLSLGIFTPTAALAAPVDAPVYSNDFSSVGAEWTTDRYAPDDFLSTDGKLEIKIGPNGGFAQRTGGFKSTFYDTQGKSVAVDAGGLQVWKLSADLLITDDMLTGNTLRRTDLWATIEDAEYPGNPGYYGWPIIGFCRLDPADVYNPAAANVASKWRWWQTEDGGWNYSDIAVTAGWHTLSIVGGPHGVAFLVDGTKIGGHALTASYSLKSVIMQAFNFGTSADGPEADVWTNGTKNYSVFWDNLTVTNVASDKSLVVDDAFATAANGEPVLLSDGKWGIKGVNAFDSVTAAAVAAPADSTIYVYPGTYDSGTYVILNKDGVTVQGVEEDGTPITDYRDVKATVGPLTGGEADMTFHVVADNVTIAGIRVADQNNKDMTINGDNFTLKDCEIKNQWDCSGAVYFYDPDFDTVNNQSSQKTFNILNNRIYGWGVALTDGTGYGWPASGKVITGNTFGETGYTYYSIGFRSVNGTGWCNKPVGGVTITGNTFKAMGAIAYVWFDGNSPVEGLDFRQIMQNNSFPGGVVHAFDPAGAARRTAASNPYNNNPVTKPNLMLLGKSINNAIADAQAGDTVIANAGTYSEDVTVNKAITLQGAGMSESIISGPYMSTANALTIAGPGATVDGFTITRDVDTLEKWQASVKNQGVCFTGNNNTMQNCKVIDNRNGVYINNTRGNKIQNCIITQNRTGFQLCNYVDGTQILNNTITDNLTLGILFNIPYGASALADYGALTIEGNTIAGNWYGDITSRWTLTTNHINATHNYFGTALPVKSAAESTEPGYSDQIPAKFGGTAPAAPPNVNGVASNIVDIYPWYTDSVGGTLAAMEDTLLVDDSFTAANGEFFMFEGKLVQMGTNVFKTIQDAVAKAGDNDTIHVLAGTYTTTAAIEIAKPLTIQGVGDDTILTNTAAQFFSLASPGITIKDLKFLNSKSDGSMVRAGTQSNIANLTIDNCTFMNGYFGITIYAETPNDNLAKSENIQILNCKFKNLTKGFYTEKFNNSVIKGCTFENVGSDSSYNYGAAIDINLKHDAYTNVKIEDNTFTGCGVGSLYGTAVTVKARGTGSDSAAYNADPATLTNTSIKNNTFTGNKCDVYFGEPGKDNLSPTGTVFEENNLSSKVINYTLAQQDASKNYWGSAMPAFSTIITGDVKVFPFYMDSERKTLSVLDTEYWVDDSFSAANEDYFVLPNGKLGKLGANAFKNVAAAVKLAQDGDIVNVMPGEYGLTADSTWLAGGQKGWFLPITQNNLTLRGVDASGAPISSKPGLSTAMPLIYGAEFKANGVWATQNLVTVFGNNVTIRGISFMPKSEPNKTIEIVGANPTVKYCRFMPTNKMDVADVGGVDYRNYGGSLYFSGGTLASSNVLVEDNYFFKTCISFDSTDFEGGIVIRGNTLDTPASYFYNSATTRLPMIGNTTWASPAVLDTCTVTIENNQFINLPTVFDYAVRNRMNGQFIMKGNFMEGDDLGRVTYDYARYNTTTGSIYIDTIKNDKNKIVDVKILIDKAALTSTDLSGITASAGILTPAFQADITDYTVNLDYDVSSTTLTAAPASIFSSVTADGDDATSKTVSVDKGASRNVEFAVTAKDGTTKTYTVTVSRAKDGDVNLASLTASAGSLSPAFSAATTSYTLTLDKSTASVTLNAAAVAASSALTIDGAAVTSKVFTLDNGETKNVDIVVTADSGATKTYTVAITRALKDGDASLKSLVPSAGSLSPSFYSVVTSYTLNLDKATASVTLDAAAAATANLTIDGDAGPSKTFTLANGETKNVDIVVTAEDGTTKTYTVAITRALKDSDASLASLTASAGSLSPAFYPAITSYTLKLDKGTASVTLEAAAAGTSTFTIDGSAVQSKTFTLSYGETKNVDIVVTAEDGKTRTYTVAITREMKDSDASLKSLVPSVGSLSPSFSADTTSYTLLLNKVTDTVTITVAPALGTSKVTVDGEEAASKTVTVANNATQKVVFTVTAENGATKDYTVTVKRGDYGTIKMTLKDGAGKVVAGAVAGLYYDAAATSLYKKGTTAADGTVTITGLDPRTYYLKLISVPSGYQLSTAVISIPAQDGKTVERTLVIAKSGEQGYVYNSLQLKSIKASAGTLSPKFDPEKTKYTLKLNEKTSKVKITPALADSASTMYINNKKANNITLTLKNGQSKIVTIKVVSGKKSMTYTVTVSRAKASDATLKSLKFSRGTLKPKFNASTLTYTLSLTSTQLGVRFTPSLASALAKYTFTVDGKKATSKTIYLEKGQKKTLVITVTAQDGTKKKYTIVITRAK